jgi:hypothetical protein
MASKTIDELLIKLGIDPSGVSTGAKKAEKELSGLGNSFNGLRSAAGAAVGFIGGAVTINAFKNLIKQSLELGESIAKLSSKFQTSIENTQKWAYAAQQSNTPVEALASSMRLLSVAMVETAKKGNSEVAQAFKSIGVSVKDANGNLKDTNVVFSEVITALSDMAPGAERTALAVKLLGRGAAELNPLLDQGSKGIKNLYDGASKMGQVLDTETIKALDATGDSIEAMQKAGANFVAVGVASLSGGFITITNEVSKLLGKLIRTREEILQFTLAQQQAAVELAEVSVKMTKENADRPGATLNDIKTYYQMLAQLNEAKAKVKTTASQLVRLVNGIPEQGATASGGSFAAPVTKEKKKADEDADYAANLDQKIRDIIEKDQEDQAKAVEESGKKQNKYLEDKYDKELKLAEEAKEKEKALLEEREAAYQTLGDAVENVFQTIFDQTKNGAEKWAAVITSIISDVISSLGQYASSSGSGDNNSIGGIIGAIASLFQTAADGGPITGGSGTRDDVPVLAMGGEYMVKKAAVRHYGGGVLEAINRMAFPKAAFAGIPAFDVSRPSGGSFASGGLVTSGGRGGVKIVNLVDSSVMRQYLNSPEGRDAIVNVVAGSNYEINLRSRK